VSVTLSGRGFNAGSLSLAAGSGISVTINSSNDTQIQASFQISTSATSGNHSVTATAGGQTSNAVTFSVQLPYQVEPINTQIQGAAVCPTGMNGWSRTVTNQLQTSTGTAIAQSGITMADSIHIGTPNDLGASDTNTGSHPTDASGNFPDTYFVCSTACPGSGTTNATQSWTYSGNALSHSNAVVYKCSSITVDGH
jgi:hypothetical protein